MVKCEPALPALTDGTAGDIALTMADWATKYHDCRIIHDGLVDALAGQK